MTLLIFLLILSILVLIHEFGHFISAKKLRVRVEEFGLGIPPRIFGKKIGETTYSINALPFGGFVRLYGEDSENPTEDQKTSPRSFLNKTPLQRFVIIVAGVTMNFLLAISCFYVLFLSTGFNSLSIPLFFDYKFSFGKSIPLNTVVSGFSDNSSAKNAGVKYGEAVISIDDVKVTNVQEIRDAVKDKPNQDVSVLLKDLRINSDKGLRRLVIRTIAGENGQGILGVYVSESVTLYYSNKITAPFQHSYNVLAYSSYAFKEFIKLSFKTKSVEPVSAGVAGPVGIYSVIGSILSFGGKDAVLGLVDFIGILSLSLALINILPLPALDGGRLAFITAEIIKGKPIDQRFETTIHKWGMIFFFGLLFLVTIKDIFNLLPIKG
ncbi:hypothetical protein A2V49_00415 [candidate division WWE3 bacterium RBG_19FT_COMBO_34_6]|uniref:Peptidase M50 domain-containing protein n=1 Tax=candidate division WWE3 bacterium RBG_19FT_COMBO_34_6 TaxID=1802612 RepID=A0A1F4UQ41_UNCKA|nr:MAG: hypothetical protein A2V49_00415 [candidate division WWE3 bacterium RBG_19FT_COMBO_34_6]